MLWETYHSLFQISIADNGYRRLMKQCVKNRQTFDNINTNTYYYYQCTVSWAHAITN